MLLGPLGIPGCTDWNCLRSEQNKSFREKCLQEGLLGDDKEYYAALDKFMKIVFIKTNL